MTTTSVSRLDRFADVDSLRADLVPSKGLDLQYLAGIQYQRRRIRGAATRPDDVEITIDAGTALRVVVVEAKGVGLGLL